ncbi:MAG: hypothetical protein J6T24_05980 [Clostridia bacterium]|nr:hypothetical protein [Clostridia bacterium]
MTRRFDIGRSGLVYELSEGWRMLPDPEGIGRKEGWERGLPEGARPTAVPSCWNFELDLFTYTGDVWYETELEAREENVRLVLGAVNNECDVYVDGAHVASHYGAFMEFGVDLPHIGVGRHSLVLRVSALHNMVDTIPLERTDWYNYGGIIRPVEVHAFKEAAILRFRIRYTLNVAERCADATLECDLRSFVGELTDTLSVSLCGKRIEAAVTLSDTKTVTLPLGRLCDLDLWDIDRGNLYTAEVSFAGDTLRDRIGFREFRVEGMQLILNGRPVAMRGINRHEEHPAHGFAVPADLIKRDLDIVKHLGCNTLRGSHYPNSKMTLDLLDEMGIMFWEEIPMWGFKLRHLTNETVKARAVKMHEEMITRDYNRPSIVVWGLENEAETISEDAFGIMQAMHDTVRRLDPSRPITYTANRPNLDCCYQFADIVSVNLYPAWYGSLFPGVPGGYESWPRQIESILAHMEEVGAGDKPLMLTEFGGAGIAGCVDPFIDVRWTEPYQTRIVEGALRHLIASPRVTGTLVWQFADCRSAVEQGMAMQRPRGFNNKGILSEHRVPKQAFYTVREQYTALSRDGFAENAENM